MDQLMQIYDVFKLINDCTLNNQEVSKKLSKVKTKVEAMEKLDHEVKEVRHRYTTFAKTDQQKDSLIRVIQRRLLKMQLLHHQVTLELGMIKSTLYQTEQLIKHYQLLAFPNSCIALVKGGVSGFHFWKCLHDGQLNDTLERNLAAGFAIICFFHALINVPGYYTSRTIANKTTDLYTEVKEEKAKIFELDKHMTDTEIFILEAEKALDNLVVNI